MTNVWWLMTSLLKITLANVTSRRLGNTVCLIAEEREGLDWLALWFPKCKVKSSMKAAKHRSVVYIIHQLILVCPFDYTVVAGSGKVGSVNQVNHTSWVAVVTPTDRPKSVRNRCLIELFCGVVCVVTAPFDISVGVGAFVIGLSQIFSFLFLWSKPSVGEQLCVKGRLENDFTGFGSQGHLASHLLKVDFGSRLEGGFDFVKVLFELQNMYMYLLISIGLFQWNFIIYPGNVISSLVRSVYVYNHNQTTVK